MRQILVLCLLLVISCVRAIIVNSPDQIINDNYLACEKIHTSAKHEFYNMTHAYNFSDIIPKKLRVDEERICTQNMKDILKTEVLKLKLENKKCIDRGWDEVKDAMKTLQNDVGNQGSSVIKPGTYMNYIRELSSFLEICTRAVGACVEKFKIDFQQFADKQREVISECLYVQQVNSKESSKFQFWNIVVMIFGDAWTD